MPLEKSSGLATSMRIFPFMFSAPASFRASNDAMPWVQLKRISPNLAASAKVPCEALGPLAFTQAAAFSFVLERDPIMTSWPIWTSFVPMACPTIPVPRTPSFMFASEPAYAKSWTNLHRPACRTSRESPGSPRPPLSLRPGGQGVKDEPGGDQHPQRTPGRSRPPGPRPDLGRGARTSRLQPPPDLRLVLEVGTAER